ncbi:LXG domain-containing protein [Bacillus sp. P14.5]|uniref:LXG domain-containing protein n=1 Tax=Bacillus sp. P14.5 TaxID=1983400 RepID=UPI000DE8E172|nr:LXG domain-containing protein [Bacillus sp. P14.5]
MKVYEAPTLLDAMSERLGEYETLRDQLQTLKNSFQAIVELDDEFQGKGADAIKSFYSAQIHVVDIWIQLTERNIAFFGGIHDDAEGRNLSRETVELPFLEENLHQSERRSDQMIDAQQRELEGILDRIRDIHPLNVFSRERFDTHLEQARKKREDTLDSINRFDEELKREYQHLESSEQMITGLMRQLMDSSRQGNHISPLHFNAAAYYSSNAYQLTDEITAQTESYLSFKEAQEQAREPNPVPEEEVNENPFMESLNSFKDIAQDFWGGMENRSEKKFDSFYDFGNYITSGALGAGKDMWKGMEDRAEVAMDDPSNFINYLTMGGMDLYNGAVNPDDAFSKEHWLNSFGLAALLAGGAKPGLGVKGQTTVSATARQAVPKVSLNQRWNEIRLGLDDLYNRPMMAAENGMLKGGFGEPGWSRFSVERDVKGRGVEHRNKIDVRHREKVLEDILYKGVDEDTKRLRKQAYTEFELDTKELYKSTEDRAKAFMKILEDQDPWPLGFNKDVAKTTLKPGARFEMALGPGQPWDRPGGFGTFDRITDTNYVRNQLAVKSEWKPDIDRVVVYEVIEELPVISGKVGPQIEEGAGKYLSGGGHQVQLLVKPADRMKYLKKIEEIYLE